MYRIRIRRKANRKLRKLRELDRLRIVDNIVMLGRDPDDPCLDTKELVGRRICRLRVGSWRILYERDDAVNVINIEKIRSRGDAYK